MRAGKRLEAFLVHPAAFPSDRIANEVWLAVGTFFWGIDLSKCWSVGEGPVPIMAVGARSEWGRAPARQLPPVAVIAR